jgi:CRP-like cAMP-binding protein
MLEEADIAFLYKLDFFRGLPDQDFRVLIANGESVSYGKHSIVHNQGDTVESFEIVVEGWIKLSRMTLNGEESVAVMLTTGEVIGEGPVVLEQEHYFYTAEAVRATRLIRIPAPLLKRIEANSNLMVLFVRSLYDKMSSLLRQSENSSLMSAKQLVACHLLYFSADIEGKGGTFVMPYDKYDAAHSLGLSPESFSRALTSLKSHDVHVKGREIRIADFAKLAGLCRPDCAAGINECRCVGRLPPDEQH